jgi:hypothetical protein
VRRLAFGLVAAVVAVGGACASLQATSVVSPRDLDEASGRPRIDEIRDIGGSDIPAVGGVRLAASDGTAVIGETLWIRGGNFGRQPTVSLGGKAVTVVSRTADGGILVRVPVGTPAGRQSLVVSQAAGDSERPVQVRRLGVVMAKDRLAFLEMTPEGPRAKGGVTIPNVQHLQLSADGRAAYTVDQGGALRVFEMPAAGQPSEVFKLQLGPGVRGLFAASVAHRLLALRETELVELDTSSPLRPVVRSARALPDWLTGETVLRVAASPDGRLLALALAKRNRVLVFDVDNLRVLPASAAGKDLPFVEMPLFPNVQAPVLVDLSFSPEGDTLWVLSGGSDRSKSLGPQPTTVTALRLPRTDGTGTSVGLARARAVVLSDVAAPVAVGTGRSLALTSGSAVRLPPEKVTVFVSGRERASQRPAIFALDAEDHAAPVAVEAGAIAVGRTDVTPDGRWVLGTFVDHSETLLVASAPADGRPGKARSFRVADRASADTLAGAELRLQP